MQQAWADFLRHVQWEVFVTLTFDPERVFPTNSRTANRETFSMVLRREPHASAAVGSLYALSGVVAVSGTCMPSSSAQSLLI